MAVRTVRSCDLDPKHEDEADQYIFGYGAEWYRADLCPPDAAKLEKALDQFAKIGTPLSSRDAGKLLAAGNGNSHSEFDPAVVRAWCLANGKQLGDRGRIPAEYVTAWREATQPKPPDPK